MSETQEVKRLTEPDRPPTHCGVPMRKLTGVVNQGVATTYVCAKGCGAQQKGPTMSTKEETK